MRRLLLLLFFASVSLGAIEIEQGDLRLTLDERSARFAVSVRDNGGWTSLLFPNDIRTSATDVLESNQVHRLGDSGQFSQEIQEGEFGPQFVWESATLVITQSFELIRGVDADYTNALQIRTTVTSSAEERRTVGVRFLLDTWLGEQRNIHFVLPGTDTVDGELQIDPTAVAFLQSISTVNASTGFQLMLGVPSVTRPESVYLANWQRLSSSSWGFQHNPTRNFNRLPYSINDSAILLTYPSVELGPGETYEVVLRLGDLSPNGYADPSVFAAEQTPQEAEVQNRLLLGRLSELLSQIAALSLQDEIDSAEILRLQQQLQLLGEQIRGR